MQRALGDSASARLVLAHDWAATPLGAMAGWPAHLRTAAALVLRSPVAMVLLWGDGGTLLYNDAYAAIAADKHPQALGSPVLQAWPDAAAFNADVLARVLAGNALSLRDQEVTIRRHGELAAAWFDLDYAPLVDDDGRPVAVLAVVVETTDRLLAMRRSAAEQARTAHLFEQLRDADERLHRAQEYGGVGTFTTDIASDRVHGTRQFYRIFGLPESDSVPAATLEKLVLPEDAALRSDTTTRQDQSAALNVEYRIRRASDGALRWIARRARFEPTADGAARLVGAVQDITAHKAALQAAQDSEAQFRSFAQALPNHVWTAPASGQLDWLNDRAYAYSGAPAGTLHGSGWARIVHPDDAPAAADLWAERLATGHNYDTEFRIRRHDGAWRWHLARAIALRDSDGAITRWIGTNTDIHQRKLAEAESTRDRDRIWTLSQELMLVCDFQGVIKAVNPAATRILGWPTADLPGRTLNDFLHPDDVAATLAEMRKLARGITTLAFENRYRRQDGGYSLLSWTAVPDGSQIHAVARDVTRERAAEEGLRQAQKLEAIGQLTGGVAHDFNNVLAVIRTSIDLLRRVQLSDERRHRFMDAISNAVTRATRLTAQLLAFARRQALQPVVFDAGHNTRGVTEMIASLTGAGITIDVQLAALPCFVHADPSQFDTALVNLAVNARDAMDGGGTLTIRVAASDGIPASTTQPALAGHFVAVAVRDTGAGIAPEHLAQIFEPFFTTKAAGQGTGLGLSQVFGFARQSGGDIRVDSAPGAGSCFTLYLPRAADPVAAPVVDTRPTALVMGQGARILVVEDNSDVAGTVEHTLLELGYSTLMVASAEHALAELERDATRFVAVFSDVMMAGMSGIELGRHIRQRYAGLPVLLSSGYSAVLAESPDHGFPLLPKPYALDELSQALHDAIQQRPGGATARRRKARLQLPGPAPAATARTEAGRLAELASLAVMDTSEDAAYDELTRLAANLCGTPIALISLVDSDRQWFKSRVGLQAQETPREHAFCAHAIADPGQVMVVGDASADPRFAANPLVTGDPNIRFYAGAPLVTSNGQALGTLCVIDRTPRQLASNQLETLQFLASQVIQRLEAQRAARQRPAPAPTQEG